MRSPFARMFRESPFKRLLEHAEIIKSGGKAFRTAMVCYLDGNCDEFEKLHLKVTAIESDADRVKRNIRGHLPRGLLMPVDKFLFLSYLRVQDKVMDALQDTLHWLSFRTTHVPDPLVDDLLLLVDKVLEVVDHVPLMVREAIRYFRSLSAQDRDRVKGIIRTLRQKEFESDQIERKLKSDIFLHTVSDPISTFHLIRLIEFMGTISDNGENAGDMMRAMIAR